MNDDIKLHTNPSPLNFAGLTRSFAESDFVFLGVPFDGTVSYKPGCRFGPASIRELSMNIETYSIRSGIDLEDVRIHDAGDLNVVPGDVVETLRRVEAVTRDIHSSGRRLMVGGGEHTITLPIVKGLGDVRVLHFDAHGDLRDEYLGEKICHATVMRRVCEAIDPSNVLQVGIRALSREEVRYAKEAGVSQITSQEMLESSIQPVVERIQDWLSKAKKVYITVDLDVFDPAYAPGVGNPEAEGLTPNQVLRILAAAVDSRAFGIDVVELSPPYDQGQTATLAARIFFEFCCLVEKRRSSKRPEPF